MYNRNFIRHLSETTDESIKQLAADILPAFFDSSKTQSVVVCNPSLVSELVEQFKQFNIELLVIEDLEQSVVLTNE